MSSTQLNRLAPTALAVLLSGCAGGLQPNAMPSSLRVGVQNHHSGRSWMSPSGSGQNLLYIADGSSGGTLIYTYIPGKYHFVGVLSEPSIPGGPCVDKAQNIFLPGNSGGSQVIYEYAHGGTSPIGILGESRGVPGACAIDPKTGNLAVTIYNSYPVAATIAVYQKAAGTPKYYTANSLDNMPFCAYDGNGNLFVDGLESHGSQQSFALLELPSGGKMLTSISLPKVNVAFPEGVQWDGTHLAVVDQGTSIVYQFAIQNFAAKIVGQTQLKQSPGTWGFLTAGGSLISAAYNGQRGAVQFYKYPAGGNPIHTITGVSRPYGIAVSLAASKNR